MATATKTQSKPADAIRRTFADNMRAARVAKGMTQVQLSDRTGWSQGWISQLERGERVVDLDELATLAKILGVTAQWLVTPAA